MIAHKVVDALRSPAQWEELVDRKTGEVAALESTAPGRGAFRVDLYGIVDPVPADPECRQMLLKRRN